MNSSARRDATIVTGAASVLAFAALLVPQVAGAFNLTTLGKALAAVGVGLFSASGQRLISRFRARQAVIDALRTWPPERLGGARLSTLGVFPAHDVQGHVARYQPRPRGEDEALAEALKTAKTVIVHGPAGCGKSRAISEAAARELLDVPAVIPLDTSSLHSLLNGGIDLPLSQPRLCLWLDGVDRFIEAIDPCSLAAVFAARQPALSIVATIRTDEWTTLTSGSGQTTESARALAQEAQVVELGAFVPQPGGPPADPPAPRPAIAPSPRWRDGPFLLLVGALLAAVAIGAIFQGHLLTPASIGDQIDQTTDQILADGGPGGGHIVVDERVQFHATDQPSWLLVTEDLPSHDAFSNGAAEGGHPAPRSDDLRIYDVVGGRLKLRLHFRPRGLGLTASEWDTLQAGATPSADYEQNGSAQVIAGYSLPSEATNALLPFGIEWRDGEYSLVSLTPMPPMLGTQGLDRPTITFRRQAYLTPITLTNAVTNPAYRNLQITGYRVQTFALAHSPLRLLTGYFSAYPYYDKTHVLEIHANQFRNSQLEIVACRPGYYACPAPAAAQDAHIPPDKALDNGLLEAWDQVGARWTTPVRVTERPIATER